MAPASPLRHWTLLAFVIAGAVVGVAPAQAGPTPFATDSVWNAPLAHNAEIDPRSTGLVAQITRTLKTTPPWINTTKWSTPVYTVPADQPTVPVTVPGGGAMFTNWTDVWHLNHEQLLNVPLPADASPAPDLDAHAVVYQPSTDTYWEFWQLRKGATGWQASWGGRITNVSQNPGYFEDGQYGSTATGLPQLGGLIRLGDLRAGHIDHAISFAIPHPLWRTLWSWPAQRSDGDSTDLTAIPEGARFRIDPRVRLASLQMPPVTRMIAEAVQKYGMILTDKGGCVCFYAEDPSPTGANPYPQIFGTARLDRMLKSFPWARLQALKLRLNQPIPAPAASLVSPSGRQHASGH